ncbi:hypothetical protein B0H17DRAFT_1015172 [Mycena rosella]|uniref:Myb-like domain-containing protein n=1 Tax=Mycena rosella TaxID=1033263 RepID=A0AAD7GE59_MYCRO|nr:hypothetical protein B0H17DRAFT_1015172 [Mycena rosella]
MRVWARTNTRAQGREVSATTAQAPAPKQQRLKLILSARSAPAAAASINAHTRSCRLIPCLHFPSHRPISCRRRRPRRPLAHRRQRTLFPRRPAAKNEEEDVDAPRTVLGKRRASAATAQKQDTYEVMWHASEQNLLERLLPARDAKRYQKISIAMGRRRTPRQVSSRVQKYRQKLKQFGVGVDGGAGEASSYLSSKRYRLPYPPLPQSSRDSR